MKANIILGLLLAIAVMGGCVGQEDEGSAEPVFRSEFIKITTIKERGGRVDWSHSLDIIAFDKRGDDTYYDVYLMAPDGSNELCLTDTPALPNCHHGNPAWHPSGEWIVFQSVNVDLIPSHIDAKEVNQYTNPGAGWLNNIWVTDKKGELFYQLTDVDETGGVLHPHFSHEGSHLLWAERIGEDSIGSEGIWALNIAEFVITEDGPRLHNISSYDLGDQQDFLETHGFSPDDTKALFSGNLQRNQPFWGMDIYEFDVSTHTVKRLTDTMHDWDEHAHYSPDGKKIIWISSTGYDMNPLKAEYWIMDSDGSHKQQLTFFNSPDHSHYRGTPIMASDSSWSPDGRRVVAYIKTESAGPGSEGSIIMIEFQSSVIFQRWMSINIFLVGAVGLIFAVRERKWLSYGSKQ